MARDTSDVGHDIGFAVRWQSFRAFEDTGWVTLSPLTLLLGSNSAGKSSFLAPLLLLKQSLHSKTGSNALLTRGDYIDVGVYDDFVRNHLAEVGVVLGVRWHSHPPNGKLASTGGYPPGGLVVEFGRGRDPQTVIVKSFRVEDTYRRAMLTRALKDDGKYSTRMVAARNVPSGRRDASRSDARATRAMRAAISDARPTDFLFLSRGVRVAGSEARREADRPTFRTTIDDARSRVYCSITDFTEWAVRDILDGIHYIGPLREEPKRVYELSGEMPDEVGTRGEYAPEIVYRWRSSRKRMREVQKWLRHFGFSEELGFEEVGTGGFSIKLIRDGEPVASTFVDTGFGMSQVLPLIVQGLLSEPGEWILIEQPEIHLNPRLQGALGDLFVEIVKRGVGLVVESHSEHLLLRLRHLAARRDIEAERIGLYFVAQAEGISRINHVAVEPGGYIDPKRWPTGFFEDALRESMALAGEQARDRKRRKRQSLRAAQLQLEEEAQSDAG